VNDSPDPAHAPIRWSPRVLSRLHRMRDKGVGPGISFGAEMVRRSGGIPQGLICCAHGGTTMKQWDPQLSSLGGTSLYGSLLRVCRATGQPIAGVLWYQGESDANCEDALQYTHRMEALIQALRKDLKQPRLCFLLAQLGRECNGLEPVEPWNSIQIQQMELARRIANTACVATIDLPLADAIHLSSEGQFRLGRRYAAAADRLVYKNRKELPPPELERVRRLRHLEKYSKGILALDVEFKNVVGKLHTDGMAGGFALMNRAGQIFDRFYRAEVRGHTVRLEATDILQEHEEFRLVYGYGRRPFCSLADERDMAVGAFGPARIADTMALSRPFSPWQISAAQTPMVPVEKIVAPPDRRRLRLHRRESNLFVTPEETTPTRVPGLVYFFTSIEVPEAMRGNLRVGYDAPIRIWIDGAILFTDPLGINPIILDEAQIPVTLKPGRHNLAVVADFQGDRSWGFVIRFNRTDLSPRTILDGRYRLPQCRA
jgi:carbohydrate esterase-like sialic acid-specific acetylesterase